MIAKGYLPGVGAASKCEASGSHRPEPLRFVWHHIQPHEAGGPTIRSNLAELCDSCHYSVHRLLYHLARDLPLGPVPRQAQLELAREGLMRCHVAGTVGQIPNEG